MKRVWLASLVAAALVLPMAARSRRDQDSRADADD